MDYNTVKAKYGAAKNKLKLSKCVYQDSDVIPFNSNAF